MKRLRWHGSGVAMDSIELVRNRAAVLHADLVSNGANPADAYSFILQEAERRDIQVRSYPAGHAMLNGGRALYDPNGAIRHERTSDTFLDAFFVAHEIGHDEFGGHTQVTATDNIDPSRLVSGASGTGKVVDYSHRARQEVLMDIFARELLFPRPLARRWHLDEGLSAQAIAVKLSAPYDLVAVQIFDAIWLPAIPVTSKPSTSRKSLNKAQEFAATHRGEALLVRAGPGTGKTQTLIGRLASLRKSGVDPASILVLTFSNKAAGEMTERAMSAWPEAAGDLSIGTFHSFGLDVLRRFHDRADLPADPTLLDTAEAVALLESEFVRLKLEHFKELRDPTDILRDLLAAISRAKDEVVDHKRYRLLAQSTYDLANTDDERIHGERCIEIANVYDVYEALKRERGTLDFGDLVSCSVALLDTDAVVRNELQKRYGHVLVDEYQDVNHASVRLLKALKPDGRGLWVVGDAKQSIYRFRGASSVNMARFRSHDFPSGEIASLTYNYRSYQEICDAYTAFALADMRAVEGGFEAQAHRGSQSLPPIFVNVGTKDDELDEIAARIEICRKDGIAYRDQAVLCKSNDRLAEVAASLEARGVPILFLGPLFDRPEVKEALAVLSLIVDPRAVALVKTATSPEFSMPLADVVTAISALGDTPPLEPLEWRDKLSELDSLSAEGSIGMSTLITAFEGFTPSITPWRAFASLYLDRTRLGARYAQDVVEGLPLPAIALWQLQNFLRAPRFESRGYPISRLLDHVRRLVVLSDERDLRDLPDAARSLDAVRLLTIHKSKGLEFKAVHLPSLTAASLPQSANQIRALLPPNGMIDNAEGDGLDAIKARHEEEQECLFFVALSRAEDRLFLYAPSRQRGGRSQKSSPFIDRLGDAIRTESALAIKGVAVLAPQTVDLRFDEPIKLSSSQLNLYDKCPRRFLFTHVLRLGGRRTETAFMKMHAAVQQAINALLRDPESEPPDFDKHWQARGPADDPNSEDYKAAGRRLLDILISLRAGDKQLRPNELEIDLGSVKIVVTPDDHVEKSDGRVVVRRIWTGRKISTATESLDAAAFQLAANGAAGVEFIFLADEVAEPIAMSARKLKTRRERIVDATQKITAGDFPPNPGRACPRCPHFFICSQPPPGKLVKNNLV